jgi:hypothetical protein
MLVLLWQELNVHKLIFNLNSIKKWLFVFQKTEVNSYSSFNRVFIVPSLQASHTIHSHIFNNSDSEKIELAINAGLDSLFNLFAFDNDEVHALASTCLSSLEATGFHFIQKWHSTPQFDK